MALCKHAIILFGRIVLLVSQVTLDTVVLNHLHVLQYQRSAVFLCVVFVILSTLSQCLVRHSQRLCSDPLLPQHRISGLLNIGKIGVVDVIERDKLVSFVMGVVF